MNLFTETFKISFYFWLVDYTFILVCNILWTVKCRTASSSMAVCDELTDYFLELKDIEQEDEGTDAVDEDSLRTPDGLFVISLVSKHICFTT